MLLQVGELAKRTGLTIRTLHHYDSIGLLQPSARSEAGYRLYSRQDIARLHQIQALRGLGMSLADIGAVLNRPDLAFAPLIDQQIQAIDQMLQKQMQLRDRLSQLRDQIQRGEELELDDWLKTLELMSMYEQYFTKEELANLTFLSNGHQQQEWNELTQEANALFNQGISPSSEAAQKLAVRWMQTLERNTASNPEWLLKLNTMHTTETAVQEKLGVSPKVVEFILQAFSESKLNIFARYLTKDEFSFMQQNYAKEMQKWPELLVQLEKAMASGVSPDAEQVQALAQQWLGMLQGYAGKNPETHAKIRQAMQNEPELAIGTWLKPATLQFLEKAVAALMRCA